MSSHDDGDMDMSGESTGIVSDKDGIGGIGLRNKRNNKKEKLHKRIFFDKYISKDREALAQCALKM